MSILTDIKNRGTKEEDLQKSFNRKVAFRRFQKNLAILYWLL